MKRYSGLLFFCLFLSGVFSLGAQTSGKVLYSVAAEPGAEAVISSIEKEMELRFEAYNRLFRFDPAALGEPLKVRIFSDRESYDRYITERLGETMAGAVYLHYNQIDRRELVIHKGSPEEAPMTAHQAFIQYLRAFVENPPSWMREGFAIFYSTLRINTPETLSYEENLLWLESVKNMGDKLPSPEALLLSDVPDVPPETPADFQISSWALVSFLLNGGRDYFRALTDSFMLLSPSAGAAENSLALMKRISLWNDMDALEKDFRSYLDARKTFKDLMDEGHRFYSLGDTMNAELSFLTAMDQRPQDFAPHYYLGLLSYEEKNYDMAEQYYTASLERGADEALVNYALGINAAAAGRSEDAAGFLNRAAAGDPARYRTRAEELLKRIQN